MQKRPSKIKIKLLSGALLGLICMQGLLLSSCGAGEDRSQFYLPAEFEPTRSTCFVWSIDYYEVIPRLISIISMKDKVTIFLNELENDTSAIRGVLQRHGSNLTNIEFVKVIKPLDNIWFRDYGPVYLINKSGEKKLVQFNYFWTNPGVVEELGKLTGIPVIKSSFNSSGGSRETNGKGTLILCEAHELDVNQPKSRQEIEDEMMDKLLLKKIIWLKKGIPQDDSFTSGPLYKEIYPKGVNGHVDEFCRFVNANTILITSISKKEAERHPILEEARKRMDENYEILVNSTDQDGEKFNVIKVPMAPLIITDRRKGPEGELVTSVTSYMNFIITNSSIILPSYVAENSGNESLKNNESEVERIFKQVFPVKEIIKVRADTINYFSGGFHCASIHEPYVEQ